MIWGTFFFKCPFWGGAPVGGPAGAPENFLPVGAFYFASWRIGWKGENWEREGWASVWEQSLPVGGLLDLVKIKKNFLVTLPQIFCMGKKFSLLQ